MVSEALEDGNVLVCQHGIPRWTEGDIMVAYSAYSSYFN